MSLDSAPESHRDDDFASALSPAMARALAERGVVRAFPRGKALFHQGQMPDRVLLLQEGHVKVFATTTTGREVVLAVRGPGQLVGEIAAIDGQPRSASVVALEPVTALSLMVGAFRAFLAEHPAASFALLEIVARRLRDADVKRMEFSAYNAIGRVASRLLELSERFGRQEGSVIHIALPLTQEELAGWTGASVESVGRALQTMRTLRWIETRRRDIRILDVQALRRAAA